MRRFRKRQCTTGASRVLDRALARWWREPALAGGLGRAGPGGVDSRAVLRCGRLLWGGPGGHFWAGVGFAAEAIPVPRCARGCVLLALQGDHRGVMSTLRPASVTTEVAHFSIPRRGALTGAGRQRQSSRHRLSSSVA